MNTSQMSTLSRQTLHSTAAGGSGEGAEGHQVSKIFSKTGFIFPFYSELFRMIKLHSPFTFILIVVVFIQSLAIFSFSNIQILSYFTFFGINQNHDNVNNGNYGLIPFYVSIGYFIINIMLIIYLVFWFRSKRSFLHWQLYVSSVVLNVLNEIIITPICGICGFFFQKFWNSENGKGTEYFVMSIVLLLIALFFYCEIYVTLHFTCDSPFLNKTMMAMWDCKVFIFLIITNGLTSFCYFFLDLLSNWVKIAFKLYIIVALGYLVYLSFFQPFIHIFINTLFQAVVTGGCFSTLFSLIEDFYPNDTTEKIKLYMPLVILAFSFFLYYYINSLIYKFVNKKLSNLEASKYLSKLREMSNNDNNNNNVNENNNENNDSNDKNLKNKKKKKKNKSFLKKDGNTEVDSTNSSNIKKENGQVIFVEDEIRTQQTVPSQTTSTMSLPSTNCLDNIINNNNFDNTNNNRKKPNLAKLNCNEVASNVSNVLKLTDEEKKEYFDSFVFNSIDFALLYIRCGIASLAPFIIDFSFIHYMNDNYSHNKIQLSILRLTSFFPMQQQFFTFCLTTFAKKEDFFNLFESFAMYQIKRIHIIRQSSINKDVQNELNILEKMSDDTISSIRAFWNEISHTKVDFSIASLGFLRKQSINTRSAFLDAIEKFPNSIQMLNSYCRFLSEAYGDYKECLVYARKMKLIEQGRNVIIDHSYRSFVNVFPEYLKKRIFDIHGSLLVSSSSSSNSVMNSERNAASARADNNLSFIKYDSNENSSNFASSRMNYDQEQMEYLMNSVVKQGKLRIWIQQAVDCGSNQSLRIARIGSILQLIISFLTTLIIVLILPMSSVEPSRLMLSSMITSNIASALQYSSLVAGIQYMQCHFPGDLTDKFMNFLSIRKEDLPTFPSTFHDPILCLHQLNLAIGANIDSEMKMILSSVDFHMDEINLFNDLDKDGVYTVSFERKVPQFNFATLRGAIDFYQSCESRLSFSFKNDLLANKIDRLGELIMNSIIIGKPFQEMFKRISENGIQVSKQNAEFIEILCFSVIVIILIIILCFRYWNYAKVRRDIKNSSKILRAIKKEDIKETANPIYLKTTSKIKMISANSHSIHDFSCLLLFYPIMIFISIVVFIVIVLISTLQYANSISFIINAFDWADEGANRLWMILNLMNGLMVERMNLWNLNITTNLTNSSLELFKISHSLDLSIIGKGDDFDTFYFFDEEKCSNANIEGNQTMFGIKNRNEIYNEMKLNSKAIFKNEKEKKRYLEKERNKAIVKNKHGILTYSNDYKRVRKHSKYYENIERKQDFLIRKDKNFQLKFLEVQKMLEKEFSPKDFSTDFSSAASTTTKNNIEYLKKCNFATYMDCISLANKINIGVNYYNLLNSKPKNFSVFATAEFIGCLFVIDKHLYRDMKEFQSKLFSIAEFKFDEMTKYTIILAIIGFILYILCYISEHLLINKFNQSYLAFKQLLLVLPPHAFPNNPALFDFVTGRDPSKSDAMITSTRSCLLLSNQEYAVINTCKNMIIQSVNPTLQKLTGFSPDQVLGQSLIWLIPITYNDSTDRVSSKIPFYARLEEIKAGIENISIVNTKIMTENGKEVLVKATLIGNFENNQESYDNDQINSSKEKKRKKVKILNNFNDKIEQIHQEIVNQINTPCHIHNENESLLSSIQFDNDNDTNVYFTGLSVLLKDISSEIEQKKMVNDIKNKNDKLLSTLLPAIVLTDIRGTNKPALFSSETATLIKIELTGLSEYVNSMTPKQLMNNIESIFINFDILSKKIGNIFNLRNESDSFIAVSGLFDLNNNEGDNMNMTISMSTNNVFKSNIQDIDIFNQVERSIKFCLEAKKIVQKINVQASIDLHVRIAVVMGHYIDAYIRNPQNPDMEILSELIHIADEVTNSVKNSNESEILINKNVFKFLIKENYEIENVVNRKNIFKIVKYSKIGKEKNNFQLNEDEFVFHETIPETNKEARRNFMKMTVSDLI